MEKNKKERKKMLTKKKLIVILVVIFLLISGFILFFKLNSKEELTYLKTSKELSKQGQYLNEILVEAMDRINGDKIGETINLSDVKITDGNYNDCNGTIEFKNGFYSLSTSCEKEKEKVYKIKQTLSKGSKLFQMHNISKTEEGYLFWGTNEASDGVIGVLNKDGILNWETEVDFDSDDLTFLSVEAVNDGYIAVVQKNIDEKSSELKIIKIDKTGKINKTNVIKAKGYVLLPKSNNNDIVIISSDDKLFIMNKDGDVTKEIVKSGITSIAISGEIIYCVDSNETIYSFDKTGKKKTELNILDQEKSVMFFEVINNKYFIVYNDKVLTIDSKGNVINDFNYSSLAVLNDKTPKDHEKGIMLNCYKNGNNLYVTYMVDGYIILDKYSQSFELLKRNIYENQYLNINSGFYNLNMFSDNETININYSPDYKLFIKTIYE